MLNICWIFKLVERRAVTEEVLTGTEVARSGGRGRLYLTLRCHHQNDFSIKTGSDGSRLNVAFIVSDKFTTTVSINHSI